MFIAPVGSVSFKNNASVNFRAKHNNDTEGQEYTPSGKRSVTDLAKMPVIVLLAMTPVSTEGKLPEMPVNPIRTEIVSDMADPIEEEDFFIRRTPEVQQADRPPFGYQGLRNDAVKMVHDFKINGESCHLVLTSTKTKKSTNSVDYAYIIYDNKKPKSSEMETPPEIKRLIYHNIGKDKEFCGALIDEDIIGNDGKYKGEIRKEVRLDDDTAQILIDLITDHSKFTNESIIKLEEVQTPQLHPVKIYE